MSHFMTHYDTVSHDMLHSGCHLSVSYRLTYYMAHDTVLTHHHPSTNYQNCQLFGPECVQPIHLTQDHTDLVGVECILNLQIMGFSEIRKITCLLS